MSDDRQEKAKDLIKFAIQQTPVGYLTQVLENLKKMINEKIIGSEEIQKELRQYEEDHLESKQVDLIKSSVLISSYTKDANGFYYDQGKNVKFKINPLSGKVENAEETKDKYENRDIIEKKLIDYINKYYRTDNTKYNVFYEYLSHKVYIIINSKNVSGVNFYSGEWISIWEHDFNTNKLEGSVKINSSYYEGTNSNENSNVQFHFNKNFECNITGTGDEVIAGELIKFIEKCENEVQTKLNESYNNFSEDYIDPLRRRMPVIRQKMNWSLDQVQLSQITK